MEAPEYVVTQEQRRRWEVCVAIVEAAGDGHSWMRDDGELLEGLYHSELPLGDDGLADAVLARVGVAPRLDLS